MKAFLSLLISASLILLIQYYATGSVSKEKPSTSSIRKNVIPRNPKYNEEKMKTYADAAKVFIHQKKYNPACCFLIDMSLPSGQPRFFIYDLGKDSVIKAGLVAHGNC